MRLTNDFVCLLKRWFSSLISSEIPLCENQERLGVSSLSRTLFDAASIRWDVMVVVQFPGGLRTRNTRRVGTTLPPRIPPSIPPLIFHIYARLFRILVPLRMVLCGQDFSRRTHALHVSTITDDAYEPRRRLFVYHIPLSRGRRLPTICNLYLDDVMLKLHYKFVGRLHFRGISWIENREGLGLRRRRLVSFPIPSCS